MMIKRRKGLSLLEMTVCMLIFSLLTVIVTSATTAAGKVSIDTENKIGRSDDCMAILDMIKVDIKSSSDITVSSDYASIEKNGMTIVYEIERVEDVFGGVTFNVKRNGDIIGEKLTSAEFLQNNADSLTLTLEMDEYNNVNCTVYK